MTLDKFIENLLKLQVQGHGSKKVYYRNGASGDCGELSSVHVTRSITECGPFDLADGEKYISVYAGN